jgi:hypothetical protein
MKEVTSVMRVVDFGFWYRSVSELESLAHDDAAAAAAPFDGPETDG